MISGHLITHQCIILDYCVEATIRCAMDLCDDIYINDGNSDDGTLDILHTLQNEYGKDRIKLFIRNWQHNRRMWADEKNFILDKVPSDNYILCIDADECFHEDEMVLIKNAVKNKTPAISFNVIHFYGRPTHYIEGPHWYKQHTRLWHRSTGIRIVHKERGCADDVLWPNGMPAHIFNNINCGANIYHYGNCRSPKALGMKAKKADDLYQYSNEYRDGKVADPRSFTYDFENIKTKLFERSHPMYIKDWYDIHKDQETVYDAGDTKKNKLWCFEDN
jgi:hypothetical protein